MNTEDINKYASMIRSQEEKVKIKKKMLNTSRYNTGYDEDDILELESNILTYRGELRQMINEYLNSIK
jgi:hypothetical protein